MIDVDDHPGLGNALLLSDAGDAAMPTRLFAEARKARPDSWIPPYNLACLEASRGRGDEALSLLLAELPAKGFDDPRLLEDDPDLAPLRSSPRFAELRRATAGGSPARR